MKIVILLFCFIFVSCLGNSQFYKGWDTPFLNPNNKVVLNSEHTDASRVFDQCSRSAPSVDSNLWMPDYSHILEFEKKLYEYSVDKNIKLPSEFSNYYCQYVGFYESGGEKRIYGNFFLVDSKVIKNLPNWRTTPLLPCDGGRMFFGVVFDFDNSKIIEVRFNGNFTF